MAKVKMFSEMQQQQTKALVEHGTYEGVTRLVTFDPEHVVYPEDVTPEMVGKVADMLNGLSGAVEVATGNVARDAYEKNNEVRTITGSLKLGNVTINSEHTLEKEVGEEKFHGLATTIVDYAHSDESSKWLEEQRAAAQAAAQKLFG